MVDQEECIYVPTCHSTSVKDLVLKKEKYSSCTTISECATHCVEFCFATETCGGLQNVLWDPAAASAPNISQQITIYICAVEALTASRERGCLVSRYIMNGMISQVSNCKPDENGSFHGVLPRGRQKKQNKTKQKSMMEQENSHTEVRLSYCFSLHHLPQSSAKIYSGLF